MLIANYYLYKKYQINEYMNIYVFRFKNFKTMKELKKILITLNK